MTDYLLVQENVNAKKRAFRRCYDKHGRRIYDKALYYTGSKDAALSLVRGVFTDLYHKTAALTDDEFYDMMLDTMMEAQLRKQLMPIDEPLWLGVGASAGLPAPDGNAYADTPLDSGFIPELFVEYPAAEPAPDMACDAPAYSPEDNELILELVDYIMATQPDDDAAPDYYEPSAYNQAAMEEEWPYERRSGGVIVAIILSVLALLALWCVGGILMDMEILPKIDLGYTWFNEHIYPMFW